MSTVDLPVPTIAQSFLSALVEAGIRTPITIGTPVRSVSWTPDLTVEEQATVDTLLKLVVGATLITPAEAVAIRDDIVVIRDLRQLGRNAFMALTAADRDRALYDAQAATTTILLAILRE